MSNDKTSQDRVDALILAATSSLGLRNNDKMGTRVGGGGKENLASAINENSVGSTKHGDSRWRSKALAALSQLSSLQQRASAAELKACELQLVVDQATLTAQALDDENSKVRAMLAQVQDERDQLMLQARLHSAKTTVPNEATHPATEDTRRDRTSCTPGLASTSRNHQTSAHDRDGQRATIEDLTSQLNALRMVHDETKMENDTLRKTQLGLEEHIGGLQERVAKLQDECDFFSALPEEDILPQEEDMNAVFGLKDVETDVRAQLQDRERELLDVYETLDEERDRSTELAKQCARQCEELEALRDRVNAMKHAEGELAALKAVHAVALENTVRLQLEIARLQQRASSVDQAL